jgi:hypothetical protein
VASKTSQHSLNQQIEEIIRKKDAAGEEYSREDIALLQQYEGSGGQGSKGATGEGLLYEFFTPDYIVDLMWGLAERYGFTGDGTVLEPSAATGRLLRPAPEQAKCTAFEINPVSARICQITYPGVTVYNNYFETAFLEPDRFTRRVKPDKLTWLHDFPFSLVIGNPPYGKYKNKYSSYFPSPSMHQIEMFFVYNGLKLLEPDGLLVYLISSNFLRNGISSNNEKNEIGKMAELVDAYRLPPVFRFSEVPVDIIVLRKK